jgi:hypothetical protein
MIAYLNGGGARLRSGHGIVGIRKVDSVVGPASKICHVSCAHEPDSTPIFGIATGRISTVTLIILDLRSLCGAMRWKPTLFARIPIQELVDRGTIQIARLLDTACDGLDRLPVERVDAFPAFVDIG